MTTVFVHGVPETAVIWAPLIDCLQPEEVATPQLPGFGCPLPDGFEPTMQSYADWLAEELAAIEGPIDLVAHDWGALLSLRLLPDPPADIRSWAIDASNLDASFEWHDMARVWQTPGEGEAMITAFIETPLEQRGELFTSTGVPADHSVDLASHLDATMGAAILSLYRSAVEIGSLWGPGIDKIAIAGLCIDAGLDGFRSEGSVARLAARTGAKVAPLPDQGHWWMLDDPAAAARTLTEFWSR